MTVSVFMTIGSVVEAYRSMKNSVYKVTHSCENKRIFSGGVSNIYISLHGHWRVNTTIFTAYQLYKSLSIIGEATSPLGWACVCHVMET